MKKPPKKREPITQPFYKKRPAWWLKLLDLFHINEKQYWVSFSLFSLLDFILFFMFVFDASHQEYYIDLSSYSHLFCIYFALNTPLAPFGYYWAQEKRNKFPSGWIKNIFLMGDRGTSFEVILTLLSPLIILYKVAKHCYSK